MSLFILLTRFTVLEILEKNSTSKQSLHAQVDHQQHLYGSMKLFIKCLDTLKHMG